MLILTRNVGEVIVIGDNEIRLHILGVRGQQVRLGVDAPKDVAVHREEIYIRVKEEKGKAQKGPAPEDPLPPKPETD